jgi:hypothetical protein
LTHRPDYFYTCLLACEYFDILRSYCGYHNCGFLFLPGDEVATQPSHGVDEEDLHAKIWHFEECRQWEKHRDLATEVKMRKTYDAFEESLSQFRQCRIEFLSWLETTPTEASITNKKKQLLAWAKSKDLYGSITAVRLLQESNFEAVAQEYLQCRKKGKSWKD